MILARKALEQEIDIVELIRMHRYQKRILEKLMSPKERSEMRQAERYTLIDPDQDEKEWWPQHALVTDDK